MSADNLPDLSGLTADELEALDRLLPGAERTDEIRPRAGREAAPLSSAQRRLWIIDQLRPGDPAYHLTLAFRLHGPLDIDALRVSLTELVRRHEALRTTFVVVDGEPRQRISPPGPVALHVVDLSDLPPDERETRASAAACVDVDTTFALDTGPLFRARLVRLGACEHILVLTMHHIVSDGWSMGILMDDLAELYASRVECRPCALPELRLQYADYAAWQQEQQRPEAMHDHLEYWRRELAGAPDLQLPLDRARERTPSTRGGAAAITIDPEVLERLTATARSGRATRYMALLAAYVLLLSRYARQRDVVIGTSIAGRTRADVEPIVGFFVNALPLRITIPERVSFRTLLGLVRDRSLAAYERQDLTFDALVDALAPERTFDRHPVFQVAFSAQDMLRADLALGGVRAEPYRISAATSRFDFEVYVVDIDGRVELHAAYNAHLFESSTVERMLAHYGRVLRFVADDPDADIDTLELLTPAEHAEVVGAWNDTAVDVGPAQTVLGLFHRHVRLRPHADAVVSSGQTLSYLELDARADRVAGRLRRQGVERGALVGLCVERSVDMIAALVGIMKAGAAFVPLDSSHPPERLTEMVDDARPTAIVVEPAFRPVFTSFSGAVLDVRDDDAAVAGSAVDTGGEQRLTRSDLAYVIYTSGSTGRPKGTLLEHGGLVNVVSEQMRRFGIGPDDRVLQFASLSFDASVFEIVMALGTGAALVVARREELVPGPTLAEFMARHAVSATVLPPSVLALVPAGPLPSLRVLTVAGEACPQELINQWGSGRRFWNLYGPTETTIWATASEPLAPGNPPVIGRPIGNTRVYVLDDRMNPVPVGVTGEMYIGGCGIARGYLRRPRLTAERFVPDPFSTDHGARLYRTGDLVRYRRDGVLEFVGRRDHQVKLHGLRVELGEIEAALSEIPGVETAVVKLWERNGTRRLVAYVLASANGAPSVTALREALRKRLPPYMVPGVFVHLDALPLTTSGKLNRAALPEPQTDVGEDPASDAFPRNRTEDTLARVWAEVLGLSRVGIHDNFFDVGGDSILSIQIASRARAAGVPLAPQHFFEHQTVAEQAALLSAHAAGDAASDVATGVAPVTPIQQWFFDQQLAQPGQFTQEVLLEATVHLDVETIRAAIAALVDHHDALRSRFRYAESGWSQDTEDSSPSIEMPVVDVSATTEADRAKRIADVCASVRSTIDPGLGRLVAAAYLNLGPERPPRVFLAIHHLVVDGVSWRVLLEDLESAVNDVTAGRRVRLPAKTTSFRRWAECVHALPGSEWFAAQEAHWASVCRGGGSRLPVDVEIPRDQMTYGASESIAARFTPEETEALLRHVPRAAGARVQEVLFSALALALAQCGASGPSIDVESHGRNPDASWNLDLSRTVGWFTAVYPVRVDVTPEMSVSDALALCRRALADIPAGGIGYGLVRYLSDDAELRRRLEAARPDVVFNYLGQLDSTTTTARAFRVTSDCQVPICGVNQRPYGVEVNARVTDGVLHVNWTVDPRMYSRRRVERCVEAFADHVRTLITLAGSGGGRTDFDLAALADSDLQRLLDRYRSHGVEDVYPLTPLQHGMVVHSMASDGSGAFVTQIGLMLDHDVDPAVLREAWNRLHREHPILRTVFADVGNGEFRQVVLAHPDLAWAEHDWCGRPAVDVDRCLESLLAAERQAGFEIDARPPSRVTLVRKAPRAWQLIWTHHHALLDGWSGAMLLDELFAAYRSLTRSVPPSFPERRRFREHVAWLNRQDRDAGRDFWRRLLGGVATPTALSADRAPGARVQSATQIHEKERALSADLTGLLNEFASSRRLTLSTVVHGAWALLLSRYSGARHVVFGSAVAGRPPVPGVEQSIGLFMNGIPVLVTVDGDRAVTPWLLELQKQLVRIREREHDALWEIQEWSGALGPLFETTLAFESYPVAPSYAAGAAEIGLVGFTYAAHTSSALHVRVLPGERIRLMLSHDSERFTDAVADVMLGQLERALRQFAAAPDQPLDHVSLRTGAEPDAAAALPTGWPGPAHAQFSAQASRTPQRVAILDGAIEITYRELDERSDAVAQALRDAGSRADDVVGLFAPRGAPLVTGMLGTLKAGAAFTVLDPAYPTPQIVARLNIAGATVVLCAGSAEDVPAFLFEWARARTTRVIALMDCGVSGSPTKLPDALVTPDSLAYVAFTSGSTGEPKPVLARHAALANYAQWLKQAFDIGTDDRFSMLSALSHDPVLRDVFPPLQLGATLCIPGEELAGTPGALADWAASMCVTRMNLTPSMAQLVVEGAAADALPALRQIFFVGEPLTVSMVKRVHHVAPAAVCVNLYGTTETQQALAFHVVDAGALNAPGDVLPAGRGMPGVELLIARGRQPAAVGEPGDIWVRSPLLARGYGTAESAGSARFVEDAFGPATGRAYRTGDVGRYLPNGDVLVLGRDDDQLKIRGFRVEPAEIESALLRHPDAGAVAVVGAAGRGTESILVAYVTGAADASELKALAASCLPPQMVPQWIVRTSELPRTPSGKIDRRSLAKRDLPGHRQGSTCTPPQTPTEIGLAEIWRTLLSVAEVDRSDSFFELGGHSVSAARLTARIRDRFNVDVRLSEVFARPRLQELAACVDAASMRLDDALVGELLDEIRNLSPEELQAMLADANASPDSPVV